MLIVGLAAACIVIVPRIQTESKHRTVEVILDYASVASLAEEYGADLSAVLHQWRDIGVSAVAVNETTVDDLIRQGRLAIWRPAEWGNEVTPALFGEPLADVADELDAASFYVAWQPETMPAWLHDELIIMGERLGEQVVTPAPFAVWRFSAGLDKDVTEHAVRSYALGFDPQLVTAMYEYRFRIVLRPLAKAYYDRDDVQRRLAVLSLPREAYGTVVFAGDTIPLAGAWQSAWQDAVSQTGRYVAFIEMTQQHGASQLISALDYSGIRLHSISQNELNNMTPATAIARWMRAVKERTIRALYVRVYTEPTTSVTVPSDIVRFNTDYIQSLVDALQHAGYHIGAVTPNHLPPVSVVWLTLITAAVGVCFVALLRLFVCSPRWLEYGIVLAWGVAGLFAKTIAVRQFAAFGAAVIVPALATSFALRLPSSHSTGRLHHTVFRFMLASAVSLVGASFVAALLSSTPFAMGLSVFAGVKLMHVVPPCIVALHMLWGPALSHWRGVAQHVRRIARRRVPLLFVGVLGLVGLIAVVIVLRTGNDMLSAHRWEQSARQWLELTFGIRPRTKEFLLGHPIFLLSIYWSVNRRATREWRALGAATASVGQLSLVNTFAHIHTPFVVSLLRTLYGMFIGLLLGCALIWVWRLAQYGGKKQNQRGRRWTCGL